MTARGAFKVSEVAQFLGISTVVVRRKIWSREWPSVRIGRAVRVAADDLERILRESRKPADPDRAAPGALSAGDIDALLASGTPKVSARGRKEGGKK